MDKFTKQDFLKLTDDEQLEWIESNIQDYEGLLYGDGYLGCSYPVEQIDVAEYEENRDDYGTSHIIQKAMGGLSLDRLEAIEDGAELWWVQRTHVDAVGFHKGTRGGWRWR